MTVGEKNYKTVRNTIELAKSIGAKDISIATIKPNGRGEATLTELQQREIVQQILQCMHLAQDDFKILATDVIFFLYDLKNYEKIATSDVKRSCSFGRSSLHIQTNGDILGCTACSMVLGNIFNIKRNEMNNFWQENATLELIRKKKNLSGICGKCKYKEFCGGCRCRAYALTGDLFGDDPYCPLVQKEKLISAYDPVH